MALNITYRPLTGADCRQLELWMQDDPEHQDADSTIFTAPVVGRSQFVIEKAGEPVFYVAIENVARVHIQFNPKGSKLATAKALIGGFGWLMENLKQRGYFEVIFESRYASLISFCRKALGFLPCEKDYSARLR